jgi:phosphoglycolate phosphatase
MPLPRLLVFDLDGTLIDSRIDLANSVNAMLAHYGRTQLALDTIASYIGEGAGVLVRRSLAHAHLIAGEIDPHDDAFVDQALAWFIDFYHVHKLDFTYVYDGVEQALCQIRQRHPEILMAVLTNKPVIPSRAICTHFGFDQFFFRVYGGNSFANKKPHPEGLLYLLAEASSLVSQEQPIRPEETIMVGDSSIDVETARACGVRTLGCSFGLDPKALALSLPDRTVGHAGEWPSALDF